MENNWIEVKGNKEAHDFLSTPLVVGVLVNKVDSPYGGHDYIVDVNGKQLLVYGKTALKARLEKVEIGTLVRITYKGKQKNPKNGRTFDDFTVDVASNPPIGGGSK